MKKYVGMTPLFAFEFEEVDEQPTTGGLFDMLPVKKKKETPVVVQSGRVLEVCPKCGTEGWKELVGFQGGDVMCTICSWEAPKEAPVAAQDLMFERVRLVRYLDGDNHPVANALLVTDFGWLVWTWETRFNTHPWHSLLAAEASVPTTWVRREVVHLTDAAFAQGIPPPWNINSEPAAGRWMQLGFDVEVDDDRKR